MFAKPSTSNDPYTCVIGARGVVYECTSLAEIDAHLERLVAAIKSAGAPNSIAAYRADIDLLLGRRSYLETTA